MPAPLPSTTARLATSDRRLDIQGLRAVAVLMVVAFHAGLPVPGGFVGVDVFFVISGFVITAMLQRERLSAGRIRFGQFYVRRFKRLTPALAVMVAVTIFASVAVLSPLGTQQTAARTAIGAMLLVANVVIARTSGGYFDAPAENNPLLNTWSLSVEEQFYLAFPAVLALGWVVAHRFRALRLAPQLLVALIAAGSLLLAVLGSSGFFFRGSDTVLGFYSPFTRAWEFALGALLALAGSKVATRTRATVLGAFGAGALVASLWLVSSSTPFPGAWTLLPVGGTLLLLVAGTRPDGPITTALAARPFVLVGDWSYSIYLWHWPFIVFAGILWPGRPLVVLAAAVTSFAPAIASYRWIETPLRSLPVRSRAHTFAIIAVTVTIPLALSCALLFSAGKGFWLESVRAAQSAILPDHAGQVAGCATSTPQSQRPPGACTWNASSTGPPIYLVGDSTADHFSEAIIAAGGDLGRPVSISTTNACPFVDASFDREGASTREIDQCRAYVAGTLDYLTTAPPGLVIMSSDDEYWSGDRVKRNELSAGLTSTITDLHAAGQRVLLVQTAPRWTDEYQWGPTACTMVMVVADLCQESMPRTHAEAVQGPVRAELAAVAERTGATLMDTWPLLCPDLVCHTQIPGLVRYRDATHITVQQSNALAVPFARAIGNS